MRGLLFPPPLFCSTGGDGVDPLTVCVNRQLQAPARQLFTRGKLFIFSLAAPALRPPRGRAARPGQAGPAAGGRGAAAGLGGRGIPAPTAASSAGSWSQGGITPHCHGRTFTRAGKPGEGFLNSFYFYILVFKSPRAPVGSPSGKGVHGSLATHGGHPRPRLPPPVFCSRPGPPPAADPLSGRGAGRGPGRGPPAPVGAERGMSTPR